MVIRPSYYSITPASVRYAKIPDGAKLLYGEITALCNDKGYAWATNAYFAELYDVHADTIRRWVTALVKGGFIVVEIIPEKGNLRKIFLTETLPAKIRAPHRKNTGTLTAKTPAPYKDNNTSNNTVNKNQISVAETAPTKRGSRIPEDWLPSDALKAWAIENVPLLCRNMTGQFGRPTKESLFRETMKFKNHFESATGRNATKLNWDKTWMNWMLTAEEKLTSKGKQTDSVSVGKAYLDKLKKNDKKE